MQCKHEINVTSAMKYQLSGIIRLMRADENFERIMLRIGIIYAASKTAHAHYARNPGILAEAFQMWKHWAVKLLPRNELRVLNQLDKVIRNIHWKMSGIPNDILMDQAGRLKIRQANLARKIPEPTITVTVCHTNKGGGLWLTVDENM